MSTISQLLAAINQSLDYSGLNITPSSVAPVQNASNNVGVAYLTSETALIVVSNGSGAVTGYVADVSGSLPVIGPANTLIATNGFDASVASLSPTSAVIFYKNSSNLPLCCALTIDGSDVSAGSSISTRGTGDLGTVFNVEDPTITVKVDSSTVIVGWGVNGGTYNGKQGLSLISVSGGTATRIGSAYVTIGSPSIITNKVAMLTATQGVVLGTSGTAKSALAFTVSGGTITAGAQTNITQWTGGSSNLAITAVDSTRVIAVYAHNQSSTITTSRAKLNCFTVSGTTVTLGNEVMFTDAILPTASGTLNFKGICMTSDNRGVAVLTTTSSAPSVIGAAFTLSGTAITKGAATVLNLDANSESVSMVGMTGTSAILVADNSTTASDAYAIKITLS